jgi:hypothetical protein
MRFWGRGTAERELKMPLILSPFPSDRNLFVNSAGELLEISGGERGWVPASAATLARAEPHTLPAYAEGDGGWVSLSLAKAACAGTHPLSLPARSERSYRSTKLRTAANE